MSLEQAMHSRWASDTALPLLIPPDRFTTGAAWTRPPLPYAELALLGQRSHCSGSHYRVAEIELALTVYAASLGQLKHVAAAVIARFDGAAFDLTTGRVLRMRLIDRQERRFSDGTWQGALKLLAVVAT